jgi:WD40 repeat protein
LASGSADTLINIWNYTNGALLKTLNGHSGSVWEIISLNRTHLASCSSDVIIWDVTSGLKLQTLKGHNSDVTSLVSLSPSQIASASRDWKINIWSLNMSSELKTLYGHVGSVETLLHLGGNYLASGSADMSIIIWNVQTGRRIQRINHEDVASSIVLLRNGHLACNYKTRYIKIWNLTSGQLVQTLMQSYYNDINHVKCLLLLANGNLLSVTERGYFHIWYFANSSRSTGLFIFTTLFVTKSQVLNFNI